MKKLISIIIPIYNSEKYLDACLDSIIHQTYKNIEIILVNDGSIDNSLNIMKKYEKIDKRIRIVNKDNTGVSASRNIGINVSIGQYIMFVDSDDIITNDCCRTLIDNTASNPDIVVAKLIKTSNRDIEIKKQDIKCKKIYLDNEIDNLLKNLLASGSIKNTEYTEGPVAKLYKRDLIIKNDIHFFNDVKYGEDRIFNYIAYSNSREIILLQDQVYIYFENKYSTSNRYNDNIINDYLITFSKYENLKNIDKNKYEISLYIFRTIPKIFKLYIFNDNFSGNRKEKFNSFLKNKVINNAIKNIDVKKLSLKAKIYHFIYSKKSYLLASILYTRW